MNLFRFRTAVALLGTLYCLVTGAEPNPPVELVPAEYDFIKPEWFFQGVTEAERFRRELLARNQFGGPARGALLSKAIVRFRDQVDERLESDVKLKRFRLSDRQWAARILGTKGEMSCQSVFAPFEGRWFGLWDRMKVDHHWWPVQVVDPPLEVSASLSLKVYCLQFAWVGDGFGWNVVASSSTDPERRFILGSVYHVNQADRSIRLRRPHVGLRAGPNRLIWITRREVFLEERLRTLGGHGESYAITGFFYEIKDQILRPRRKAFQAVYSRRAGDRRPWRSFDIAFEVR